MGEEENKKTISKEELEEIIKQLTKTKDFRILFEDESDESRGEENPADLNNTINTLNEMIGLYKSILKVSDDDLSLSLIEKLCRLGGTPNILLVVGMFTNISRNITLTVGNFAKVFYPIPDDDIPIECRLIQAGKQFKLIIKGSSGNEYCSIIKLVEGETRTERYLVYPCPSSTKP